MIGVCCAINKKDGSTLGFLRVRSKEKQIHPDYAPEVGSRALNSIGGRWGLGIFQVGSGL